MAYSQAIGVYLSFAVDRVADFSNTCTRWVPGNQKVMNLFGRQTISMTWDYPEANIFLNTVGGFLPAAEYISECLKKLSNNAKGTATQQNVMNSANAIDSVISTDPPYYDNIGYSDLSDFFYFWLRTKMKSIYPGLFATVTVPKLDELVANPYRHDGKDNAEIFFLNGMKNAFSRIAVDSHPAFPITIYYAFKQSENEKEGTASTGWETFLEAVIQAGLSINGTWPIRTEQAGRMRDVGSNALASSVVLVCGKRNSSARTATKREFVNDLKTEMPKALLYLQRSNIAPVDLAQSAIGPGMAVFTKYSSVIDAQGNLLSVRAALTLINQTLDEVLAEQEGDFDADSRWALAWFEQQGFKEGEYGLAETLSKAKNTSVNGLVEAGILESSKGKVRLLKPQELPEDWDPLKDKRLTEWEIVHHLIRVLEKGGESAAAEIVSKLGSKSEIVKELAYRLYNICERKKRSTEALSYNAIIQSWQEILKLAGEKKKSQAEPGTLFDQGE